MQFTQIRAMLQQDKTITMADQAIVSGSNFLIGLLLARFLGLEQFGLFALCWLVVLFVSSIHQAIIIFPLMSLTPKQENPAAFIQDLKFIQLVLSGLCFLLMFPVLGLLQYFVPSWDIGASIYYLPFVSVLFVLHDFFRRLNFVDGKPVKTLALDALVYSVQVIGMLLLFFTNLISLSSVLLLIGFSFSLPLFYQLIQKNCLAKPSHAFKSNFNNLWNYTKFLIGTALLQWFSGNLFIILAGGLLGPAAVGVVRIAQQIMGLLNVLFLGLENIVPIKAAKILSQHNIHALLPYFKKISWQAGILVIGYCLFVAVFAKQILSHVFGAEYGIHYGFLMGFSLFYLLVYIGTIFRFFIRTIEQNRAIFISYVLTAVSGIVLAKPFIVHLGLSGVLLGLGLSQIITLLVYYKTIKQSIQLA